MVGMIQILTYLLAFYLVIKGLEILQMGLTSNRADRGGVIFFGAIILFVCIVAAITFVDMQDKQAMVMSQKSSQPLNP